MQTTQKLHEQKSVIHFHSIIFIKFAVGTNKINLPLLMTIFLKNKISC